MIKVFTTNKNGKIELTKDELKSLLDDAYWEGFRANCGTYTYTTPTSWSPYTWTCGNVTTDVTLTSSNVDLGFVTDTTVYAKGE